MKTSKEVMQILKDIDTSFMHIDMDDTISMSVMLSDTDMIDFYNSSAIMHRIAKRFNHQCSIKNEKTSIQQHNYNVLFNAVSL